MVKDVNLGTVMYYLSYHPNTQKYVLMILKHYPKWISHSGATFRAVDLFCNRNGSSSRDKHAEHAERAFRNIQNPSNKPEEAFKHHIEKSKNNSNPIHPNLPSPQKPSLLTKRCKFAMRWHRANDMIRATRIDGANKGACLQETAAIANPDW